MLRNNSDMPKTLKNKMVSGNPRPYSTTLEFLFSYGFYRLWVSVWAKLDTEIEIYSDYVSDSVMC